MAIAAQPAFTNAAIEELDELLSLVCEELQLSPTRHSKADQHYHSVAKLLESPGSPFMHWAPKIYPQGSMALGTTVHPLNGPHDLDFVLELGVPYHNVDPLKLIRGLYDFFVNHGTYADMVELKNRCVRLVYQHEFYIDILPGCRDFSAQSSTCIRVPDRDARSWKPSNPIGYVKFFKDRSVVLTPKMILGRAYDGIANLPVLQEASDKKPLQLIVQLLKRWRDIYYGNDSCAPISIVLTTLAALHYQGSSSICDGISVVIDGIWAAIGAAQENGTRLVVLNPSNVLEDLSERWGTDPEAYDVFVQGISDFRLRWRRLLSTRGSVHKQLEALFGETVQTARVKRAQAVQAMRKTGTIGVTSLGQLTGIAAPAVVRMPPNTYHGAEAP